MMLCDDCGEMIKNDSDIGEINGISVHCKSCCEIMEHNHTAYQYFSKMVYELEQAKCDDLSETIETLLEDYLFEKNK